MLVPNKMEKEDAVKSEVVKEEMFTQGVKDEFMSQAVKAETKEEMASQMIGAGATENDTEKKELKEEDEYDKLLEQHSMRRKFENKELPEEFDISGKKVEVAFRIASLGTFNRVLDMLSVLCKEVRFQCTKTGLLLQTMDSAQVVLVDLALNSETLKEYVSANTECNLVFRIADLQRSLKLVHGDFDAYFRKLKNEEHFQARYIDGSEDTIECGWFDARLLRDELSLVPPPQVGDYIGEIRMSSARFSRVVGQLQHFGGATISIECRKNTVVFSSCTESSGGEVICKHSRSKAYHPGANVEDFEINIPDNDMDVCKQAFAMKYFQVFSKCTAMSKVVSLKFSNTLPFCIAFEMDAQDGGHVIFHIAPKIDDEGVWD